MFVTYIGGYMTSTPTPPRTMSNGIKVINFVIAHNEYRGEKQYTEFVPCACFGKTAEFIEKFGAKGKYFSGSGHMRLETYKDSTGKEVTRWKLYIERIEHGGDSLEQCRLRVAEADAKANAAPAPAPVDEEASLEEQVAAEFDDEDSPF